MKGYQGEKYKLNKLLEKHIKLGLCGFVEVRKANETKYILVIVIIKNGGYF